MRLKQKAFTLVEMLVVVAIIGILTTIVVVSVAGGRKKALATKAKADMIELQKGFEMAASEGCRTIKFDTAAATGGSLTCASGTGSGKIYANIKSAPQGITYSVKIGTTTVTMVADAAWSANIAAATINSGYTFSAAGFSTGTFSCNDGSTTATVPGCSCDTKDRCEEVQ